MLKRIRCSALVGLLMWALLLPSPVLSQSPVTVLYNEGLVHGFLVIRTLDGTTIAEGEVMQVARGDRVTSHMILRFKDGSVTDETTVFSQRHTFHLVSVHLVQKGPAFNHPTDLAIDGSTGLITVHYADE